MYTVTLIAQKGGTGKTTLAINLAVAAEAGGFRTALVDLDPQASAAGWGDHREGDRPAVSTARLAVIDTAPHSEAAALAAARVADRALVPLRRGVLDLRALGTTAGICALPGARAAVVLNQAPPRGPLPEQAAEAITGRGLEVPPCRIGARVAFQHSLTNGLGVLEHEPAGKAASEIREIFRWVRMRLER